MKPIAPIKMQESASTRQAGRVPTTLDNPEQATTFCYENEVPSFVEPELDRIYGNFFSTLTHFRETGRLQNVSTYVVTEEGRATTIFLFCRHKEKVHVLNEVIKLDQDEVRRFSNYIFAEYEAVDVVSFHAVHADIRRLRRPYQRVNCLEDIVLVLPDAAEDYFIGLGKSTRKTIKGYTNKLKRDFPTFQNKTYATTEASEQDIRAIIELSRIRLLASGKISAFDEEASKRIIKSFRIYGLTCVAKIDGKICAGSISYRVGENYFMHVCAHDQNYDSYRLGMLYRYFTVCECIRLHGRECHFLWGRQEYKFSLLGVQRDLHDLVVYRSRMHFLLHGGVVFRTVFKGLKRQAVLLMRGWKERNGTLSGVALKCLNRLGILRPATGKSTV